MFKENIKEKAEDRQPLLDSHEKDLKIDDHVRVSLLTQSQYRKTEKFDKKIDVNWSKKIYTIRSISQSKGVRASFGERFFVETCSNFAS